MISSQTRNDRARRSPPSTARELATCIRRLSPAGPVSATLSPGDPRKVWYRSQKEHWLGWLGEYDGPGYYGRANWNRSARFIYNHIMCPPMLLWLAEASGVRRDLLAKARDNVMSVGTRAAGCRVLREAIPWEVVAVALSTKSARRSLSRTTRGTLE